MAPKYWRCAIAAAAATASAGILVAPAVAGPMHVARMTQLSHTPSLPTGCLKPGDGAPSSDFTPDMAVDPSDSHHIAVAWFVTQEKTNRPRATIAAVSHDGGRSWRESPQQGIDSCTGRPDYSAAGGFASTLSFGPGGRLYLESQSASPHDGETLWVSTSDDGGVTWRGPTSPMQSSRTFGFPDYAHVAADPRNPRTVYLMSQVSDPSQSATGSTITGKAYFTRSDDAGRTWSPPTLAYAPPGVAFRTPYWHYPFVLPDGTLVDLFTEINGSSALTGSTGTSYPNRIYAIRSTDGGATWSVPVPIADEIAEYSSNLFFPDPTGGAPWALAPEISSAIAPDHKTLYVAWHDLAPDGANTIRVARSGDGGRTWTQTTPASPSTRAFFPEIAVAGDGTVGVTWYDARKLRSGQSTWPFDVYFASSSDQGAHWSETRVAGTMDLHTEQPRYPNGAALNIGAGDIFFGDYTGLVGLPHGFAAAFIVTKPVATDGATDIDFAEITSEATASTSVPAVQLPPNQRCRSRRHLVVHLRSPRSDPIRDVTVRINGRRVRIMHGRRGRFHIDLTGLPSGRFTVSIVAHTRSGRTLRTRRTYRACR